MRLGRAGKYPGYVAAARFSQRRCAGTRFREPFNNQKLVIPIRRQIQTAFQASSSAQVGLHQSSGSVTICRTSAVSIC